MASEARGQGPSLPGARELRQGQAVRVVKQVRFQDAIHPVIVEGRLVEVRRDRTESSFAGAPEGRFWIEELVIEKAGGERSVVVVDEHTHVEPL